MSWWLGIGLICAAAGQYLETKPYALRSKVIQVIVTTILWPAFLVVSIYQALRSMK